MARQPVQLPIIVRVPHGQRYSCHSCGACCKDFTVQLRAEDLERLERQGWARERGEAVTTTFRGRHFLRQRPDGSCTFLQPDGRCEVHARFGLQEKPVACRFFPFSVVPAAKGAIAGLNFACQSVQRSVGSAPASHLDDLRQMVVDAPELVQRPRVSASTAGWGSRRTPEEPGEVDAVLKGSLDIVANAGVPGERRMAALAFFAQSLLNADLSRVRGDRFVELASVLAAHAADEVVMTEHRDPRPSEWALFRGAVHLRTHAPRLDALQAQGWLRSVWSDLRLARAWRRGRGAVPAFRALGELTTRPIPFPEVLAIHPTEGIPAAAAVDGLLSRWLAARLLGERAWSSGYYGMSAIDGLCALVVDLLSALWLARLHSAALSESRSASGTITLEGVQWGIGIVERTAGRVPWLATTAESLRLRGLARHGGLLALARALQPFSASPGRPHTS